MSTIEVHGTAEEKAGASKSRKPQSLRLEKQTIRTLTGAELKLVGGGGCGCTEGCTCACHSGHTQQ
jgi:hypothetical protein